MDYVTVKLDVFTGRWVVTCAMCGRLAGLRNFWPASRMATDHDAIHRDDDNEEAPGRSVRAEP